MISVDDAVEAVMDALEDPAKRPFFSSHCIRSGEGFRVTYLDGAREPLVSLWGSEPKRLSSEARRLLEATPEPIDAILQAIAWHGKAAQA